MEFLTEGVPETRRQKRRLKLNRKLETLTAKMRNRGMKMYLHGGTGSYRDQLERAFSQDQAFHICNEPMEADLVLTYGDCSLTGDVQINDYAEQLRETVELGEKIHLYLTFSQGNEDNASLSAEAGASIQRILVKQLVDETVGNIIYREGLGTLAIPSDSTAVESCFHGFMMTGRNNSKPCRPASTLGSAEKECISSCLGRCCLVIQTQPWFVVT